MNAQETLALLDALRSAGAIHFKSGDFEVSFGQTNLGQPIKSTPAPVPAAGEAKENPEATAKLKELIETMKMDPEQLMDKIFPAGAGG